MKQKLRDLAKGGGDDALLPQVLLELVQAGDKIQDNIAGNEEKSTQQIAAVTETLSSVQKSLEQTDEQISDCVSKIQDNIAGNEANFTQQIAAVTETLSSIQKTQKSTFASLQRKASWSIYLVSAILVFVLMAGGFCIWIFLRNI